MPAGLPADLAALTEPLAVGVHAVVKSRIAPGEAAIVLGLGPVGLACVAELKRIGHRPRRRRRLLGAAPRPRRAPRLLTSSSTPPSARPSPPGATSTACARSSIFEAVGVPGMIDAAMRMAPKGARILVVGVCMQQDRVHPMVGIGRELNIQFALGYEPDEFAQALRSIADGEVDLRP